MAQQAAARVAHDTPVATPPAPVRTHLRLVRAVREPMTRWRATIRDYPLAALGIAVGLGYILGKLARRR